MKLTFLLRFERHSLCSHHQPPQGDLFAMYPTFNNEEVGEMMQWSGAPSSFTSSEGFAGTDNDRDYGYYPPGTYSSADVTSLTSSEAYQQDSGWMNIEPISQVREAPQQYDSDLACIDPRYYLPDENIPQSLDDLGSSTITQKPADDLIESAAHPPGGLDRTTIGIPNPIPFALQPSSQPSLGGVMNQVVTTCSALISGQACTLDQVSQGLQNLETIKSFFHTKLPPPPISSIVSSEQDMRDRKLFRCWKCDPQKKRTTFPSFGTFKRHLTGHDIRDCEWRCTEAGCPTILHRRDRMHDHLINKHRKSDLLRADVEATRVRYAPPANCPFPFCYRETPSWSVYFDHVKKHCLISPGSENASTNGDNSDRGDNCGGNGNGHGSSSAGPSKSNEGSQSNQSNNRAGGTPYPNESFPGFKSRSNARPGPISHSASDDQLNNSRRQSATDAIEQISIDDLLRSSRGSRAHLPRDSGQPNNFQPPQNPGLSRADHSTKRKRKDKQKEPTEEQAPFSNKCRRCDHDMAKCRQCKSVLICHKCGDVPRSAIQAGPSSTVPVQALPGASSGIINLGESYLNPEALANFVTPQNMPTQLPSYYNPNEIMQLFDLQSFDGLTNTFMDDTSPNDRVINVAMDVESHPPLSDLGHKVQASPIFESDTKLLRSIGLGTLIDPLSVKRQTVQPKAKASGGPPLGSYTDSVFRNNKSPSLLEAPQPVSRCQCPCVTVPTVDYEAHASLQLSPNERVEMTFKMTPARESNHPLRTRVRVFVKLFSLRASTAKSNTKKQRTRSIASETTDEDAESDPDSDQELTPTSPSGSEITPLLYWTEDVRDWSFSFDIKWALTKLAQWTSGIDADTCQKLLLSDPGHILDLMSMYILYKFKICWFLMGRNGLSVFLSI
ncbi:unnamed protein product [Penicillium egyptiacum]|uniref:C2H2-type domain-containing protein n=1 Tax=Penicillium egyptiacum TaxID=1303716 RepID=A0A9W4KF63_9EURO|nr:unnamed protein product [Penicillium egyptiacum]